VESEIGRVYNTLCPAGFERGIVDGATPHPRSPCHHPAPARSRSGANTCARPAHRRPGSRARTPGPGGPVSADHSR
jgi:hypothetical protein